MHLSAWHSLHLRLSRTLQGSPLGSKEAASASVIMATTITVELLLRLGLVTTTARGRTVEAIPLNRVREILRKYGIGK